MKVILTLRILNNGDRVPFFSYGSQSSQQYKKSYSRISEKHDQTSINLTNMLFNFIG